MFGEGEGDDEDDGVRVMMVRKEERGCDFGGLFCFVRVLLNE